MDALVRKLMLSVVFAAAACGAVKEPGGGGDPDGGGGGGDFTVTASPDRPFLRAGSTIDIDVTVERGDFTGAIEATMDGLPIGVSTDTVTIADGESSTTFTLTATPGATQGDATVTVRCEAPDGTGTAAVDLLVGGAPGTTDLSFGNGTVVTSFGLDVVAARGITLQPNGKIVGTASSADQAITYRLLADGSPDPDFGNNGVVTTGIDQEPSCGGLVPVVLDDGSVRVAGWGGDLDPGYDTVLYGYTADGALDNGFSGSGVVRINLGEGFDEYHGMVVDSDGGLRAAGVLLADGTTHLRRFASDGTEDGEYTVVVSTGIANSATLTSDNKTVMAGSSGGDFWLERHLATGGLDTGFGGGDGQVVTDFGGSDRAIGVVEVSGGKLVAAGSSNTTDGELVLARYNGNGSLDLTFGVDGLVRTELLFDVRGLDAVATDSQGRILVAGYVDDPQRLPAVARLNADGTPDTTFGTGGIATIDFGIAASTQTSAFNLVIDPDDRILVSCDIGQVGAQTVGLARLWP